MLLIELLHDGMTIDLREIFNLLSQFLTVLGTVPFKMKLLKPLCVLRHGHKKKTDRLVSTWSPLATAFNTRPTTRPMLDSLRERTVSDNYIN